MLASIKYPQNRSIELPNLIPQEGAEEIHEAIKHLNEAHSLFAQDRYREAVQRCRQAKEALLGEQKQRSVWSEKFLTPIIGVGKAKMINDGILALNLIGQKASHSSINLSEPPEEIDRDVASYVIGSMTLILDYIGRKLR